MHKNAIGVRCPVCHGPLGSIGDLRYSCSCGYKVESIAGVSGLWHSGLETPFDLTADAKNLPVMDSSSLDIPSVRDAISSGSLVLELGAGVDNCEAVNLIKTDAFVYSSKLDICADAHNLPFEDNTF